MRLVKLDKEPIQLETKGCTLKIKRCGEPPNVISIVIIPDKGLGYDFLQFFQWKDIAEVDVAEQKVAKIPHIPVRTIDPKLRSEIK